MGPLDHPGWTDLVAVQSARAHTVLAATASDRPVPSCPDWTAADLTWHLAEVQWLWGAIVRDLVADPGPLQEPSRPDDAALPAFLAAQTGALVGALRARTPADRCWSWSAQGGTVGWVARRQAHEALIHRVDAELAAGVAVEDIDPAIAADGVHEVLDEMIRLPDWAEVVPDGQVIRVEAEDTDDVWVLRSVTWGGTSPRSGTTYADEDGAVLDDDRTARAHTTVAGTAWALDRWLWGRTGDRDGVRVDGDAAGAARLRSIAVVE